MSELVSTDTQAAAASATSGLAPLVAIDNTPMGRAKAFAAQPVVKRMLPWFLGVAALGGGGQTG
jgi:hypothetical protein